MAAPRPFARSDPGRYRRLPLEAHALLRELPLHDVWTVELPGGGGDRTLEDLRALLEHESLTRVNPVVCALFALRAGLGRLFGWDAREAATPGPRPLATPVPVALRERSRSAPGTPEGPFTVLYQLPRESVSEIRNATVHAALVLALEPTPAGQRLTWAVHVQPRGRLGSLYMALIDPFRRWLVYPAMLRHVHRRWRARYGTG